MCVYVVANIPSASVNIWRDYRTKCITAGTRALRSWCSAVRRAQVCCLHWTKVSGQAAVACDWLRSSTAVSPRAKGESVVVVMGEYMRRLSSRPACRQLHVLNTWGDSRRLQRWSPCVFTLLGSVFKSTNNCEVITWISQLASSGSHMSDAVNMY